jgi:zinc transport system substrate-binding protein
MFKKLLVLITIGVFLFINSGCGNTTDGNIITVSIMPQKAFAEAVVGDLAKVEVLVPFGASPEAYKPTAKQLVRINKSILFVKIGVPVEETSIITSITNVNTIDSSEKVRETYNDLEFSAGERDPHIWLSIKRVIIMTEQIADEMSVIDPDNSETYQANAAEYISMLNNLKTETQALFANKTNKRFMTLHPAYGYFADEFGLEMFALEEEGKETTAQRKIDFIKYAEDNNITVIFSQEEFDSSQDNWVTEIGATIQKLNPLSADYIENYKIMAQAIADSMN